MQNTPFGRRVAGFKAIELTQEQARRIFAMTDDMQMLNALNEIFNQQNPDQASDYDAVRTMLGEDNPCDCPECQAVKKRNEIAENNLKKGNSFPDFMEQMFKTFGAALEKERYKIEDEKDNLTQLEEELEAQELNEALRADMGIPEWAARAAIPGIIEEMSQLNTLDGRVTGNAVIFKIDWITTRQEPIFHIVTDAGNILSFNYNELQSMFHAPEWIMKDFPNNDDDSVGEMINDWCDDHYGPSNH